MSDALAGDGFLRMVLARSDSSGSGHRFARFDDESVTTAGNRPELVVIHSAAPPSEIPEPATMCAMGLAFAAVGGYMKRRKRL